MISILQGVTWLRETPESLVLFLPHGELRIAGGDLSRAAIAVLELATEEIYSVDTLVNIATTRYGIGETLLRYALVLLEESRCLGSFNGVAISDQLGWAMWARTGTNTARERLSSFRLTSICHSHNVDSLSASLEVAGFGRCVEALAADSGLAATQMERLAGESDGLVVFGPRYAHPYTKALGRVAARLTLPVLFVEASGFLARVGPCLYGRDLPCLECLDARHAANAGAPLSRPLDTLSTAIASDLPPPMIVHPTLQALAFNLAALELSRIAIGEVPQSFGGYLEVDWSGQVKRRVIHRVPFCPACSSKAIERFPYHVTPITA